MSTKVIAQSIVADGDTVAVPVESGQYFLALSGSFGGGTAQLKVNVGPAVDTPITGASYTVSTGEVIWLPDCTVYVTMSGSTTPSVSVALARLSTRLDD